MCKRISGDKVIYSFKKDMKSVMKIKPGETIIIESNDCWNRQLKRENQDINKLDFSKTNPATGPIFIDGAEIGDILKIEILEIKLDGTCSAAAVPEAGFLGDKVKEPVIKIMEIKDNYVNFNGLKLPVNPMIGVIGVAPELGEWATSTPWTHGGNMDTTDIKEGSILYLPVFEKGANFAMGDCHAIMGDGEVSVTGAEVNAEVKLKIDLIKNKKINWPLIETEEYIAVIGSGDTLEKAAYIATEEAVRLISENLNMSWEDSYILSSLVMDLKISQVVNPKLTVRAAISKKIFSKSLF